MAKQLNVSLSMTADTSQAKAQIAGLQQQLTKLASNSFFNSSSLGFTKDVQDATQKVAQLSSQLNQATNSAGQLDLSKFSESLKKSGTSINDYKKALVSLGPEGRQAFSSLASAITSAEVPLKRANALVQEFATSLANTARWQMSSSILHAFIGTIQSAYNYAQDLDRSLTDIQIVTESSSSYMADFADKANKAAQSLSTTTKAYADASLIYFQQGLSEEDVLKRTDTTVKMAQATGDAVDQVSSYMTAVWNNFAEGSENLEYYADVITKLGAATAASSSEIAEGLQRFAGISDTIGLSYEYATSILTTLVDKTRMSASEIGNSLKTIFSRFQGVTLGDTLEDGVDLNKYSNALKTIGVDILDATGEMKEMDSILDETAAKWGTLTQAQKMAFAETAAGTMQYTKLISLMENWDSVQQNVAYAEDSEGTLTEQAEIYADSWEGARKRVKAAAESIYNDLIDEDFFKAFDNWLAKLLVGVDNLIDGLGGLPGVLSLIGSILTDVFSTQIASQLNNLVYNFSSKAREEAESRRKEANDALKEGVFDTNTAEGAAQEQAYKTQASLQETYLQNAEKMTEEERKHAQLLLQINKSQSDAAIQAAKELETEQKKTAELKQQLNAKLRQKQRTGAKSQEEVTTKKGKKVSRATNRTVTAEDVKNANAQVAALEKTSAAFQKLKSAESIFNGIANSSDDTAKKMQALKEEVESYEQEVKDLGPQNAQVTEAFKGMKDAIANNDFTSFTSALDLLDAALSDFYPDGENLQLILSNVRESLMQAGMTAGEADAEIKRLSEGFNAAGAAGANYKERMQSASQGSKTLSESLSNLGNKQKDTATRITETASALMSFSTAINAFKGIYSVFTDGASAADIFTSAISGVIAITTLYSGVLKLLNIDMKKINAKTKEDTANKVANAGVSGVAAVANTLLAAAINLVKGAIEGVKKSFSNLLGPAGAVMLIITAITAAIGIFSASSEKAREKLENTAQATKEAADASKALADSAKEETDAYNDLYKQYKEAKESKEDTYEIENQLIQSARDLIDTYGSEESALNGVNVELMAATKNYDELTTAIRKNQLATVEKAKIDADLAIEKNKQLFTSDMKDGKGHTSLDGDKYIAQFNNGKLWNDTNNKTSSDRFFGQAFKENDFKYLEQTGGEFKLKVDTEDLVEGYEEVQQFLDEVESKASEAGEIDSLANSVLYKQMNEWLEKSADSYQQIKELEDQFQDLSIQESILKAQNDLGVDLDSISNLTEYYELASSASDKLTEALINQGLSEDEAREKAESAINTYLAANDSLAQYANTAEASKQKIAEATSTEDNENNVWADKQEELETFYNSLSDEEKTLFVNLDFNSATSEEDLRNQLDTLQKVADVNTIKAKVTTVNEAAATLSSDGAEALEDFGIDWGNQEEGIIEFNDFLQKSKSEQILYLQELSNKYQSELQGDITEAQAAIKEEIDNIDEQIKQKEEELKKNSNLDFQSGKPIETGDSGKALKGSNVTISDEDLALIEEYNNLLIQKNDLENQSKEVSSASDDTGFSSIATMVEMLDDVDADIDKIALLSSVWDGSEESAKKYREELLNIVSASDQMTGEEKLGMLLSQQWTEAERSSEQYLSTVTEGLEGLNGYTLSEKMSILKTLVDGGLQTATQYGQQIAEIISSDETATTNDKLDSLQQAMNAGVITATQYKDALSDLINNGELGTEGLQNLNSSGSINDDDYSRKLTEVAQQYDSCTEALEKYYQALNSHSQDQINAAQQSLETATRAAELGEKYDIEADRIELMSETYEDYVQSLKGVQKGEADAAEMATDLAIRDLNLNDAIEDLYDNWDDYQEILDTVNDCGKENKNAIKEQIASSGKLSKSLDDLRKNTAKLLNTNEDTFGDDFVIDNLDDIKAAAEGDEEALKRLQAAATEEIAIQLDDAGVTDILNQSADEIANWANTLPEGELKLKDFQYVQSLVWAMQQAGMAQEDIEDKLSAMNIDVDLSPMNQSLSEAVAAAAQAGNDMAKNMSLDSTAVTQDSEMQDTKEAVGWNAVEDHVDLHGEVPNIKASENGGVDVGENISLTGSFPTVNVTPQKETETETKTIKTPALEVKTANKTYGGNISNKNSSAGRAASGRRGGGGSRGGGRGRTARRNTESKKSKSGEIERYHKVDKQLGSLEKQYDKISKAKDRAFGKSKLKLMDQEIAKQEQIIKKQKEYLQQAKDYLKVDKKNLQKGTTTYTDEDGNQKTVASGAQNYLGMSAKFDSDGNISNYDALMEAAVNKYNQAVEEFNKHNSDDEAAKAAFEAAKQQYDGFVKWIEQYEETQELVDDKTQELIDAQNAAYDLRFEKTQYTIELEIEVNDKELEYLDHLLTRLEKYSGNEGKKISLLGDKTQNSLDRRDSVKKGLSDMLTNGNHPNLEKYDGDIVEGLMNGDQDAIDLMSKEEFTDEEMSFIKDKMSELLSINEALEESWSQIFDTMDEAFDNGVAKMDDILARQDHLMNMTNAWSDTIDILGKDFLGVTSESVQKLNQAKVTQSQDKYFSSKKKEETIKTNIDTTQAARDAAAAERDKALANGDKKAAEAWDKDVQRYDESLKKYNEEYREAQEESATLFNESLQTMRDAFDSNLEAILNDFSRKAAGTAGSLEALLENMDQQKMVADRYVPEYERIYQLTKLTRDVNKSIDETSNVKAKRELAKLQEEIVSLQESGKEQSEYDLEYLQKRYELKLAEIALEEAQNAKSQVRMTKDAEGNFSYVYTADEDSMAEAEQAYEDKLYELQKMNDEYQQQLSQSMAETMQEYQEKYAQLAELYTVGSEEYNKALEELQNLYAGQMDYYSDQMKNVLSNNTTLYTQDVAKHADLTDNKAMKDQEYVGSFAETSLAIAGGWKTQEEFMTNWKNTSAETYEKAKANNESFKNSVTEFMEKAGISLDEFIAKLNEYTVKVQQDSKALKEEMEQTSKDIGDNFDEIVKGVQEFERQYTIEIGKIISQNDALYESYMKVIDAHSTFKDKTGSGAGNDDDKNKGGGDDKNKGGGDDKNKGGGGVVDNADKAEGVAAAIWIWGSKSGWGNDPERAKKLKAKGVSGAQGILNSKANSGYLYNKYWSKRNEVLNKYAYGKFDTGGYTGDWDGEGKFAMLHQKEIVLNKDDTANFLKTVDIVRQISDMIDLNAMSASGGIGSLFAASVNKDAETLEQTVHITAEFPNATNKNEILDAFDNIVNLASQYANKKR